MLVIRQGDDLIIRFQSATNSDDTPVDLTGATLLCDVKGETGAAVASSGATMDPVTGRSRAWFSRAATATWPLGYYTYDGRALLASGLLHTLGAGSFELVAPVTPTPA